MDVYIILTQILQQISGFGQDHLLKQLENIDFVNRKDDFFE